MRTPKDHRDLLRKEFVPEVPLSLIDFGVEEIARLKKYGSWLDALMWRRIEPTTDAQYDFIHMCEGDASPKNELSALWKRYRLEVVFHSGLEILEKYRHSELHSEFQSLICRRFLQLAGQRHKGAESWLRQNTKDPIIHYDYPLIELKSTHPPLGPADIMDRFQRLPGSYETGKRR